MGHSFRFFIGKGNNNLLVKSILKERWWWAVCEKEDFEDANFIWS
jgi:hypothetical protein